MAEAGLAAGEGARASELTLWQAFLSFLITCNLPAWLPSNQIALVMRFSCSSEGKGLSPALSR